MHSQRLGTACRSKAPTLPPPRQERVSRGPERWDSRPLAIQNGAPAKLFGQDPMYSIALKGTMGPPNFTLAGTRKTPTSVWCMQRPLDSWQYRLDVLAYDDENKALSGRFP